MSKKILSLLILSVAFSLFLSACSSGGGSSDSNDVGTADERVGGISLLDKISAGAEHTCVLNSAGEVLCWGLGTSGQLGNDGIISTDHPVYVVDGDSSTNHLGGIVQVSSGSTHTCALHSNGDVLCWGEGVEGRLGNDTEDSTDYPVYVVDGDSSANHLSGIVQIDTGSLHTCALNSEGKVLCWGSGGSGQLGNDAEDFKDHPVYVVDGEDSEDHLSGIVQIGAGSNHTCALKSNGKVLCWGYGFFGQLGNGGGAKKDHPTHVVDVSGGTNHLSGIVQISLGDTHTCALKSNGEVLCWGNGGSGRLGNDALAAIDYPVYVVDGDSSANHLSGIVQISTGLFHTCALKSNGGVVCWGAGSNGQLGNDGATNKDHPVNTVDGDDSTDHLSGIVQISSGFLHTCALKLNGEVLCWGNGGNGRLGNDEATGKDHPVSVVDGHESSDALNVGSFHRGYFCDGEQCVLESVTLSSTKTYPHVIEVSGGGESEVIVYRDANCRNSIGGVTGTGEVAVPSLNDGFHPFFFKHEGSRCSSSFFIYDLDQTPPSNFAGSIPIEKTVELGGAAATAQVDGLGEEESFTIYRDRGCIEAVSERVAASGEAMQMVDAAVDVPGQHQLYMRAFDDLGNPSPCQAVTGRHTVLNQRSLFLGTIAGGSYHTCALNSGGEVLCWGYGGNGRLGNDAEDKKDHPVYVVAGDGSANHLSGIIQISLGQRYSCALDSGGEVSCWGLGTSGQLGNDGIIDKNHPVHVVDGENSLDHLGDVVQISTGGTHACVLNSGGEVLCWGNGAYGQLGNDANGDSYYRDYPVHVVEGEGSSNHLGDIVQISAGTFHTCALKSNGEALCWGYGAGGVLGNDAAESTDHPVHVVDGEGSSNHLSDIVQINAGNLHTCALKRMERFCVGDWELVGSWAMMGSLTQIILSM